MQSVIYAECLVCFVVVLSRVMLSVVLLNVRTLSAFMLNVLAHNNCLESKLKLFLAKLEKKTLP
jgi:hypothetical protein